MLAHARQVRETRLVTPLLFQRRLLDEARAVNQRIVLPEGTEPRIVRAAADVLRTGGARLILLGDPGAVRQVAAAEGVDISGADIIDPANDPLRERSGTATPVSATLWAADRPLRPVPTC